MNRIENCIHIFVASTEVEWLSARVLEFSIRETTGHSVEVTPIYTIGRTIPVPQAIENRPRTPFSFQRFLVPELCAFTGRAIYLDADMQVFQDIGELWDWPLDGCDLQTVSEAGLGRRGQFSVMLLDCARLVWNVDEIVAALDAGELDYTGLMYEMRVAQRIGRTVPQEWNALECFDPERTCLLHYTDMNTQPWISTANPLGHLWVACLRRALTTGFISRTELECEITAGHVRPSLQHQLDAGIDNTLELPAAVRRLDRGFVAPYRRLRSGRARPWTSARTALFALLRRCYYRSPLPRLFG